MPKKEQLLKSHITKQKSLLSGATRTLAKQNIYFGFALGKDSESHFLMVHLTKPIKGTEVLKAAKSCIKESLLLNKTCVGVCSLNDKGGINFQVATGQKPPEMAKKIKEMVKKQFGLSLKQLTVDLETEEETEERLSRSKRKQPEDESVVTVQSESEEVAKKASRVRRKEPLVGESRLDARSTYKKWDDARRGGQTGLDALAKALRDTGERRFQDVAGKGLAQLTKRIDQCDSANSLQAALLGLELAPVGERTKARKKAIKAIESCKEQLFGDETVNKAMKLADENPFGVPLNLRTTLGEALVEIDRQVQAVKWS